MISLGVHTPGQHRHAGLAPKGDDGVVKAGRDQERAPAATASSAWRTDSTVPAPTVNPGTASVMAAIAAPAAAVRKVISAHAKPLSASVRASGMASSTRGISTTGMTRVSLSMRSKSMACAPSPRRPKAAHH